MQDVLPSASVADESMQKPHGRISESRLVKISTRRGDPAGALPALPARGVLRGVARGVAAAFAAALAAAGPAALALVPAAAGPEAVARRPTSYDVLRCAMTQHLITWHGTLCYLTRCYTGLQGIPFKPSDCHQSAVIA